MFTVKTRREAADSGEKRYYTGRVCAKGHDSQRFTSTGVCIVCASGYVKEYSKRLTKQRIAVSSGMFVYPAHPDDHAALIAYCQGLDMQRGKTPHVPTNVDAPFDVDEARRRAFGRIVKPSDYQVKP